MGTTPHEFLKRISPPGPGFYCCLTLGKEKSSQVVDSHENLIEATNGSKDRRQNIYFSLSRFTHPRVFTNGRLQFRTVQNAEAQKSFWLDIDAKGETNKDYANLKEAVTALIKFIQTTLLPVPDVVVSGRGLHVYWPLADVIATADWCRIAGLLKSVVDAYGLKVDHSRTCDPSSVLRLPGTKNYGKDGIERDVVWKQKGDITSAAELEERLTQLLATGGQRSLPVAAAPAPRRALGIVGGGETISKEMIGSFYNGGKKTDPRIVRQCQHIEEMGSASYLPWFLAIQLLTKTEGGKELAHELSSKDPRYSPEGVEDKYREAEKLKGAILCSTFQGMDPRGFCNACANRGRSSTPLNMPELYEASAPPMPEAVASVAPVLPGLEVDEGLFHSDDFRVAAGIGVLWMKKTKDEDGGFQKKEVLICDSVIKLNRIDISYTNGQPSRAYVFDKIYNGKTVEVVYDLELHARNTFTWLQNNGLGPTEVKYNKPMVDFMNTYVNKFQNKKPTRNTFDRFGWHEVSGEKGFLIGHDMLLKGQTLQVPLAPRCLLAADKEYISKGDLETWKSLPRIYSALKQEVGQLFICSAFASPFMYMGPSTAQNIMFSLHDAYGGKGKTSLLTVINSIWGHYSEQFFKAYDTLAARYQNMALRSCLPNCLDEVTMLEDKEITELLLSIANGQEKRRSQSSGRGFVDRGSWETASFFTSNRSIYELVEQYSAQSKAPLMRMIEFSCSFKDLGNSPEGQAVDSLLELAKDNYGLAGRYMIQCFLSNVEVYEKWIKDEAMRLYRKFKQSSTERYWAAGMAIALAGGAFAKLCGLIDYDLDALAKWAEDSIVHMRRVISMSIERNGPEGVIRDFLNENLSSMLHVASANRPSHVPDPSAASGIGAMVDPYVKRLPQHKLLIRYEDTTQYIYISVFALKKFCKDYRLSRETLIKQAYVNGLMDNPHPQSLSLGKGVSILGRGQTVCYKFKGEKMGLREMLNDAVES